jgi:choline-sulfatase
MNDKTNILIIVADQLAQRGVGCYGNYDVSTPNIDALAKSGLKLNNAYTPCPLCLPARAAFWSGTLPHDTWSVSNGGEYENGTVGEEVPTLGSIFRDVGYETVHFGKMHDNGSLRGFDCVKQQRLDAEGTEAWPTNYDSERDEHTVQVSTEYLQKKHEKPFVMIADIQNPHDICSWIGSFREEHEDIAPPGRLPELPDNFEIDDLEKRPIPIQYLCCSHNRLAMAAPWTDENFRHYRAAYNHYTSRADTHIGLILDALSKSDAADNTLIVFFADHGDGMGAHRMVTKQVSFYEETTCVPMIFVGPGIDDQNTVLNALVSLSDLMPTLCDYAGLESPQGIYGRSILPYLQGHAPEVEREYVVSEWMTEWGHTIEPGRMVRTARYKYTRYIEGDGEELFDLIDDPGEKRTLIDDPDHQEVLEYHRKILEQHVEIEKDPFFSLEFKADEQWRSHPVGYCNHKGPAAPIPAFNRGRDEVMSARAATKK